MQNIIKADKVLWQYVFTGTRLLSSVSSQAAEKPEAVKPYSAIPGPRSFPIVGNFWALFPFFNKRYKLPDEALKAFKDLHDTHGPLLRIEGLSQKILFLYNPEDVETLLKEGVSNWPQRLLLQGLGLYRKHRNPNENAGIIVENGEEWYKIRRVVQQTVMRPKSALQYLPSMAQIDDDFIEHIKLLRDSSMEMPADFQNELYKWSFESIALVVLNTRLGCLQKDLPADSEAMHCINTVNDAFQVLADIDSGFPFHLFFASEKWRRLLSTFDELTNIGSKYINAAMEDIQKHKNDPDHEMGVLEQLLMKKDFSLKDCIQFATDMLMAGIDTTAHSMGFLLYHLATSPESQRRLREEIKSVLPSRDTPITAAALNKLPYVKACVKESARLLPVTGGVPRTTEKDVVLQGYLVPKKTITASFTVLAGWDEKHYPRPKEYYPERWLKNHPDHHTANPYTFLPFGHGPRMCIGRRFAEQEMWTLLIKISQNFWIEWHYEDVDLISRGVFRPDKPLKYKMVDWDY